MTKPAILTVDDEPVRHLVNRHDGEIEMESRPGHTVFTVSLPVRSAQRQPGLYVIRGRWRSTRVICRKLSRTFSFSSHTFRRTDFKLRQSDSESRS